MVELKDRIPRKPNRKYIVPEVGSPFFANVEYADNPSEEGTVVNKQNVLDTVYPESDDSSIGVQVLKAGIVNDPRWLVCDGQYISKSDYPVLYDNLTAVNGLVDFKRNTKDNPPVLGHSANYTLLYIKHKNYVLFGGKFGESSDSVYRVYVSFDSGATWQEATISGGAESMVRGNHTVWVWDDGHVLISNSYNKRWYYSADGINFNYNSPSSGFDHFVAGNRNGFVAQGMWTGKRYAMMYSTNFGAAPAQYDNANILNVDGACIFYPNKSGVIFRGKDNSYYYIDAALTPTKISTSYELLNDTTWVDEDYNIYTITSEKKLCVYKKDTYALWRSKSLSSFITDYSTAKIVSIIGQNVYFQSDGILYRIRDLISAGASAEVETAVAPGWNMDFEGSTIYNDGEDMLYTISGYYHIVDTTYLPAYADNNELSKCYIKAR